MKIKDIKKEGICKLNTKFDDSVFIMKILLSYVLEKEIEQLIICDEEEMDIEKQNKINMYIEQLLNGKPIEYITGKREFMGYEFIVKENVLVPRADTEILVENVIEILNKEYENSQVELLDMCAGTGCIALATLLNLKRTNILATLVDISDIAISNVNENIQKYGLNDNARSIKSDLFSNINDTFLDVIVSNPPYIKTDVIETLDINVQSEPHLALDGGTDGLDFYRKISNEARKHLKEKGWILFEIGYDQLDDVTNILIKDGYKNIVAKKDLSGNDRVIIARK